MLLQLFETVLFFWSTSMAARSSLALAHWSHLRKSCCNAPDWSMQSSMNYLEILMLIAALSSHSGKIRENLECISRLVRFSQKSTAKIWEPWFSLILIQDFEFHHFLLISKFSSWTFNHRTRAIISRGLYIFYPILENHFFVFNEVFFSEKYVFIYG